MSSNFILKIAPTGNKDSGTVLIEYGTEVTRGRIYDVLSGSEEYTEITEEEVQSLIGHFRGLAKESGYRSRANSKKLRKYMHLLPHSSNNDTYERITEDINDLESSISFENEEEHDLNMIANDFAYVLNVLEMNQEMENGKPKFVLLYVMD
jgi:hypothetical protein